MINIKATIPVGNAKRIYLMNVNGFNFSFELENTEQSGKTPVEVLYDELRVILGLLEKHFGIIQPEMKELPQGEQKITIEELFKPGGEKIN